MYSWSWTTLRTIKLLSIACDKSRLPCDIAMFLCGSCAFQTIPAATWPFGRIFFFSIIFCKFLSGWFWLLLLLSSLFLLPQLSLLLYFRYSNNGPAVFLFSLCWSFTFTDCSLLFSSYLVEIIRTVCSPGINLLSTVYLHMCAHVFVCAKEERKGD